MCLALDIEKSVRISKILRKTSRNLNKYKTIVLEGS